MESVAIIGAGLSGLTLAHLLKGKYNVTVYERDESYSARKQGYRIGINSDGYQVLLSLKNEKLVDFLNQQKLVGFAMVDETDKDLVRFEFGESWIVSRWKLRNMLTEGVEIEWNKKFESYKHENNMVTIQFADGGMVSANYLIGADGVNSQVRKQLAPEIAIQKLPYFQAGFIVPFPTKEQCPKYHDLLQTHLVRVLGPKGSTILLLSMKDQGELIVSPSVQSKEMDFDEFRGFFKEIYSSSECLSILGSISLENKGVELGFLQNSNLASFKANPFPKQGNVFLMGDAAHAMTTHRGLGANTALQDAADLAVAFADKQFERYVDILFSRGVAAVKESQASTEQIHSFDAYKRAWFLKGLGVALAPYMFFKNLLKK
ncbi:hypothetical protein HK103_006756 [Boothiomyces macroporosus]|uniref:FAD-binding domain-containing protein n=1 Tax=Boothiomyces macroporosus TaxID=261099 RepID=A0AAD5UDC6_9FUNG|nr:hypothetical protein HK103_006756 [Boothiomyces macroporosus]